ncbi:hypothetical protein U1Q18_004183 [Sarracenia purpurea var. burkii]
MIDNGWTKKEMNIALENDAVSHTFETPTRQLECNSCLCAGDIFVNRIELVDDSSSDRKIDVAVEDRSAINHFITPIRQLLFSALSKPSPVFGVLDDDFDESILEEIGALCSEKLATCSEISTPLMIVAGPGSGKGIGPSNILAMTFTTAAASEMRDRIGTVAGKAIAKELTNQYIPLVFSETLSFTC